MLTRVAAPTAAAIAEAAALLRDGQLVAFPTETVYGLGANGLDADARARLIAVKGRPSGKPFTLLVTRDMVDAVAVVTPLAARLMARHCPGALTLVLPAKAGAGATVGVRIPDHEVATALIRAAKIPIAAPSANLSGHASPATTADVLRELDGRVPLLIDGGACRLGVASTVVDCTGDAPRVLRRGAIEIETE